MAKHIYTKERLEEAVKNSECYTDVCRQLGVHRRGNSYQRMRRLIDEYQIDTSHFLPLKMAGIIKAGISQRKHWSEILVDGYRERCQGKVIRRALLESGVTYECEDCGLSKWREKEITLHVDHRDGNWRDCRKENLRFLCPNCHSQTDTYCNQGSGNRCDNCNQKITSKSKWCLRCHVFFREQGRKVEDRPSLDILIREVETLGYVGTGRKYGVSDNAVRKWVRMETRRRNEVSDSNEE